VYGGVVGSMCGYVGEVRGVGEVWGEGWGEMAE